MYSDKVELSSLCSFHPKEIVSNRITVSWASRGIILCQGDNLSCFSKYAPREGDLKKTESSFFLDSFLILMYFLQFSQQGKYMYSVILYSPIFFRKIRTPVH